MRNFSLVFLLAFAAFTSALPTKSTGSPNANDAEIASNEPSVPDTTTPNVSPDKTTSDLSAEPDNSDATALGTSGVPTVTIHPMGEGGAYIVKLTGNLPSSSKLSSITSSISALIHELNIKGGNVGVIGGKELGIPLAGEAFKTYYDATKTPARKRPTEFEAKVWPELEKLFPGIVKPKNLPKVE